MTRIALEDLRRILREAAGEDDTLTLDGDIADTPFTELGYDSIAMLETASRIQIAYQVKLSDDDLFDAETPQQLLDLVNEALTAQAPT